MLGARFKGIQHGGLTMEMGETVFRQGNDCSDPKKTRQKSAFPAGTYGMEQRSNRSRMHAREANRSVVQTQMRPAQRCSDAGVVSVDETMAAALTKPNKCCYA